MASTDELCRSEEFEETYQEYDIPEQDLQYQLPHRSQYQGIIHILSSQ